jgi:hypothetical protein
MYEELRVENELIREMGEVKVRVRKVSGLKLGLDLGLELETKP